MPNLFFMWIPKTGGSTLHEAFLGLGMKRHIGESWTRNPGLEGIAFDDGSEYFVGHWPASILPKLPENTVAVTMLRDPLKRVVSHYNYVYEHGYHYDPAFSEWVKKATFRQWLDSDYSRRAASNLMTRFFCDREEDNLCRALENMAKFEAVGILSDYQKHYPYVMKKVCIHIGCDPPQVLGHYSVSHKAVCLADLSPDEYDEIVRTAIRSVKSENITTFLVWKLHGNYQDEMGNDSHTRIKGTCIKHRMVKAAIKTYDKRGLVLLIETDWKQ